MMKLLTCILLFTLSATAQTPDQAATQNKTAEDPVTRNVYKKPRLSDMRIHVDDEGRFQLPWQTERKELSALKVSDLPNSNDEPLSIETTFKCLSLEALTVENEEKQGKVAKLLPPDVLAAVPASSASCLARNLTSLNENMKDFALADIAAMVDAQAELDRRENDGLVDRYNALVAQHNALLAVARDFAGQLRAAQTSVMHQKQINNALVMYSLMPKYAPMVLPPPPVLTNPAFRCTSNRIGDTTYTNCN